MNLSNYILTIDNFLSKKECDKLIDYYHNNKNKSYVEECSYIFCNMGVDYKLDKKIKHIAKLYTKAFPESFYTLDKWNLSELKIKHFKKNEED